MLQFPGNEGSKNSQVYPHLDMFFFPINFMASLFELKLSKRKSTPLLMSSCTLLFLHSGADLMSFQ